MPLSRDLIVVHTSDLHVDDDYTARLHGGDGARGLACVLETARGLRADAVILAGDTFDSHRVPQALVERAAALIAAAAFPVVILPGNHDPAIAEAVYRRRPLSEVKNLRVIGVTDEESVLLPELSLEIRGCPHRDYADMIPLEPAHPARPRRTRWQIAVAHGHYQPAPDRRAGPQPSWLIGEAELATTGADYVALGHWNRAARVGAGAVPAYYSGSPEYAGTVNVVRFGERDGVRVTRCALDIAREGTSG